MKKLLLLMCAVGLFAFSAFAQGKANYAGTWTLDKANSKLGQRMAIESMTWTVSQTGKELKIVSEVKLPEPKIMPAPAGAPPAGAPGTGQRPAGMPPMGGGRGMGRGFGGSGDGTTVYSLDGRETVAEIEGGVGIPFFRQIAPDRRCLSMVAPLPGLDPRLDRRRRRSAGRGQRGQQDCNSYS